MVIRNPWHVNTHHYVCVDCRWSVKRSGICPHCRKWLQDAGAYFKTPKKTDDKGWKIVEKWIRTR